MASLTSMTSNYLFWAVLALVAYTASPPLVSEATTTIPSTVAAMVANTILVLAAFGVVVVQGGEILPYLTDPNAVYMYLAGVAIAVGILSYFYALSQGPVSVVVPIFGLFVATSSVLGAVVLDEPFGLRKGVGVVFALLAIYFTTT